jgi:hypothetical protein
MTKNTNWELRVVENMGEVIGSVDSEDVVVPTKTLITDMKAQLMFIPKNFTWTVGWRTYVWQEKETGRFKELTQEQHETLFSGGTVSYTEDGGGGDTPSETTRSDKGSTDK